jgi:hypothetical protein
MPSISKRAPKLACVAAFVALCVIGWVAEATLAQDPAERPGSLPSPDATAPVHSTVQDLPSPGSEPAKPLIGSASPVPPSEPPVGLPSEKTAETPPTSRLDIAPGVNPAQGSTIEPSLRTDSDDPEKAALAFVEQNQKLAESQLKNLKDEEAKLRARLQKVEGGIRRWEALLGALKQSQGSDSLTRPSNPAGWKKTAPADAEPQVLDPVASVPKSLRESK